ncbi:GTPase Era [Lysinibacter cavernae]|uniref:GTPase Era n=1 Tax=Lysinibacter cavernae TaxID=1640652 RepID=A0A7X5QZS0_9MICO|nr:GTPase Era [Lysinibacter cavernae]NIH52998.1 GTP-binding protein Era [Lysinibacter cavernae]
MTDSSNSTGGDEPIFDGQDAGGAAQATPVTHEPASAESAAAEQPQKKRKPRGGTPAPEYRAGFVSFIGRPNVGKSTLTNALVKEKIAITSDKPQTTRKAIRGIVHRTDGQIIVVDTPGIHRPRTLLGERLNALVKSTLGDVDVIGFCVPANEKIGPGDRFINEQLDLFPRAKKVAILTKMDVSKPNDAIEQLAELGEMREWDAIIPLSAYTGDQINILSDELVKLMPVSQQLYPDEAVTDEVKDDRIAEYIREAALDGVRDELPHSIAVMVEDTIERDDKDMVEIYATIYVERDSQKAIIIGHKGSRLRDVGKVSRAQIEPLVGKKVFLSLHVKVAKDWQKDPRMLGRLGF